MRTLLLPVVLLSTAILASGCAHNPTPPPALMDDPISYATGCETRSVDIDHDGVDEIFLSPDISRGNGGGACAIFKKKGDGYALMGEVAMNISTIQPFPLDKDGCPVFASYWHMSSQDGIILWITYRNGRFVTRDEPVNAGDGGTDEGRRRVEKVFGKQHPVSVSGIF